MKITVKQLNQIVSETIKECGCQMQNRYPDDSEYDSDLFDSPEVNDDVVILVPSDMGSISKYIDEIVAGYETSLKLKGTIKRDNVSPVEAPQQSGMAESKKKTRKHTK